MISPEDTHFTKLVSPSQEDLWRKRLDREAVRERQYRRRQALRGRTRHTLEWGDAIGVALRLAGLWKRGRHNAKHPILRTVELRFDELPEALDGFTLLHLSDLHFDEKVEYLDTLSQHLQSVEVDVCVFTGDYRYHHWGPCDAAVEGMKRLVPSVRARHGIFAILGNHDSSALLEPYRALGIRWLINEHAGLAVNGHTLYIAGIDDNHGYRSHSLPLAMEGIPEEAFCMLLAHSPAIVPDAAEAGVPLCLCGHTHAGQICLPLIGPVLLNARKAPRQVCFGAWRYRGTQGYTTAGLGSTASPVRFNCPPEVALIRLVRGANG